MSLSFYWASHFAKDKRHITAFCLNSHGPVSCMGINAVPCPGDDQGYTLQTVLLVRVGRWVKPRPRSGAKTDLRYLCSDLDKLYPQPCPECGSTYLAIQMRCVVQPTIHTNYLWVWCSFLPYHASRFSSTENQDILIRPFFSSAACGEEAQLRHEGWGYQHGLHCKCRGPDSLLRLLSLHWEYLGASRLLCQNLTVRGDQFAQPLPEVSWHCHLLLGWHKIQSGLTQLVRLAKFKINQKFIKKLRKIFFNMLMFWNIFYTSGTYISHIKKLQWTLPPCFTWIRMYLFVCLILRFPFVNTQILLSFSAGISIFSYKSIT